MTSGSSWLTLGTQCMLERQRQQGLAHGKPDACKLIHLPVLRTSPLHRWYRAPELLYGSTSCTQGADMWSAGCVLAELLGNAPLCPGVSDVDQLAQVRCLMRGLNCNISQMWSFRCSDTCHPWCPQRRRARLARHAARLRGCHVRYQTRRVLE